jgi:hypothetical protein
LRVMARSALALRTEWLAARDVSDASTRARALWPYLFSHNGSCRKQTEAELHKIGPVAGEYLADLLPSLPYEQKGMLLRLSGEYRSPRLHAALIADLRQQQNVWAGIMARQHVSKYDELDRVGRTHYFPRRPRDADVDLASDAYGDLFYGMEGLASFKDRNDLPLIREFAVWAIRYRFKQMDDIALQVFAEMPERENLAIIAAIWDEFSERPYQGNELGDHKVIRALAAHKYAEAIPLMAPFAKAKFMGDTAQQFLRDMTGVDYGSDSTSWIAWYEINKARLSAPR